MFICPHTPVVWVFLTPRLLLPQVEPISYPVQTESKQQVPLFVPITMREQLSLGDSQIHSHQQLLTPCHCCTKDRERTHQHQGWHSSTLERQVHSSINLHMRKKILHCGNYFSLAQSPQGLGSVPVTGGFQDGTGQDSR